MYRVKTSLPTVAYVPTSFQSSSVPGKTLAVNADGSSVCIQPDGEEIYVTADGRRLPGVPRTDQNWDSPYTQGVKCSNGLLMYQSAFSGGPGVPVGFLMVVPS